MPARAAILRNIRDTLETIAILNGYRTDIARVELGIRTWAETGASERPYIGIAPDQDPARYDRVVNGVYDVGLPVVIGVHVDGGDADDRLDALDNLEDDIVTALRIDPRRGGNANGTHPISYATDEADSLKLPHGTGIFRWFVEYQRDDQPTPTEEIVHYADLAVTLGGQAAAPIVAGWDGTVPISNWVRARGTWQAQGLPLVGFTQPTANEAILRYTGSRARLFKATASMLPDAVAGQPYAGIATRPDPAGAWTVHPQSIRLGGGTEASLGQVLVSLQPNAEIAVFVGNLLTVSDVTFYGGLIVTEV